MAVVKKVERKKVKRVARTKILHFVELGAHVIAIDAVNQDHVGKERVLEQHAQHQECDIVGRGGHDQRPCRLQAILAAAGRGPACWQRCCFPSTDGRSASCEASTIAVWSGP